MADTPRSVANAPPSRRALVADAPPSRRTLVTNAPRRKPGRGSQVTPAERREIQRLHLAECLNQKQIAAQTGRSRETIAAQLKGEDFELAATWPSVSHAMVWRKSGRQRVERHLDVQHPPTLEVEHHS